MTTPAPPSTPASDPAPNTRLISLDAAVSALAALGAEAIAEDVERGPAWGVFADWAHRTGQTPLPATAATVQAWLDDDARALDTQDTIEVLDAITAVHAKCGHPDPTGGAQ